MSVKVMVDVMVELVRFPVKSVMRWRIVDFLSIRRCVNPLMFEGQMPVPELNH